MKRRKMTITSIALTLALLLGIGGPVGAVTATEASEPSTRIPDTSHIDYESYLDYRIETLPQGWTYGEWQAYGDDAEFREIFDQDEEVSGEQYAVIHHGEKELLNTTYSFMEETGEKVSVILSPLSRSVTLQIEWPDDFRAVVKSLHFGEDKRQMGYGVFSQTGEEESFAYSVDLSDDDHFTTTYMTAKGSIDAFHVDARSYTYNRDGEFLNGNRQGPTLTDSEPIATAPAVDVLKDLWLEGEAISEETVEPRVNKRPDTFQKRQIPDTSHIDFTEFLGRGIDQVPAGATYTEWTENAPDGTQMRLLKDAEGQDIGMQWGVENEAGEIDVIASNIGYPLATGELVSVGWSAFSDDFEMLRVSWPDGEFNGTVGVIFNDQKRQTGYAVQFDDGYMFGSHVEENDDQTFTTSSIEGVSLGQDFSGTVLDVTYDREGVFVSGVKEEEGSETELEKAPARDIFKTLWLSGEAISLELVEPHLDRIEWEEKDPSPQTTTIPDTSHLDLDFYLTFDVEDLPDGYTQSEWRRSSADLFTSDIFDSDERQVGFMTARGETDDDLEVVSFDLTFHTSAGEKISVSQSQNDPFRAIDVYWEEEDISKIMAFDSDARQVAFGLSTDTGVFLAYVEAHEDGSFTTRFGKSDGRESLSYEAWNYTYDSLGEFVEGTKEGPDFGAVEPITEAPQSDPLKDAWLAGEAINEWSVDLPLD